MMSHFELNRREKDVGITRTLGTQQRFLAIIKERFSDFHVNEIDPEDNIVRLTNLSPPVDNTPQIAIDDTEIGNLIPDEIRTAILSLSERLEEAEEGGKVKQLRKQFVNIKVTTLDKGDRTKIHKWVTSFDKLSSETVDDGGEKFIKVVPMASNIRKNRRRPANRGKYTHCVMYKEGVETAESIGLIAKKLNLKPGLISYAGIKDKRAKTTQRICISNMDANRLIGIGHSLRNIKLGNFDYKDRPIPLGQLKGNHFKLLLKDLKPMIKAEDGLSSAAAAAPSLLPPEDEDIVKAVDSLRDKGFINYYGMQRFGSYEISTWEIGKMILQQKWMQAFDMILCQKPNDQPFMTRAKEHWLKNRDPVKATQEFHPRHRSLESHLLFGLAKFYDKNDYINAYTRMSRPSRLLYVHAFQSYLWNQVASFRIQEYGLQPVEGDLVFEVEAHPEVEVIDSVIADAEDDEEVEDSIPIEIVSSSTITKQPLDKNKPIVKHLTAVDISQGKYSIYDVVIPQFGSDVQMPLNKTAKFLNKLLEDEGINSDVFMRFRPLSDKPVGSYRKLVVLPKNVKCEIRNYSESENLDHFIPSDLDILQQIKKNKKRANQNGKNKNEEQNDEIIKDKKCLILELSLPSSSYATMALREILVDPDNNNLRRNSNSIVKVKSIKEETQEQNEAEAKKPRLE